MGKLFIDLGTHYFDVNHEGNVGLSPNGLLTFHENGFFSNADWSVWTFEASPTIFEANRSYLEEVSSKFHEMEAYNLAVTGESGLVTFLELASNPSGSNCVGHVFKDRDSAKPSQRSLDRTIQVESIALSEILGLALSQDPAARISIKIDIEGAEFDAIKSLLDKPAFLKSIDVVFIEWHLRFFKLSRKLPLFLWRKLRFIVLCWLYGVKLVKHW